MQLELQIYKKEIGKLETNIDDLENFVSERLKHYDVELYSETVEVAKKDRAELNNAQKKIATVRKELINELMTPYTDVENRLKQLEKNIKEASSKLDEIVKVKENAEKDEKKQVCQSLWDSFDFDLFSMDKVFDLSWLNKTKKESEILGEMKIIIDRTYKDLQVIEKFADKEDVEILKTRYLEDLKIEDIFDIAEEMKKNREKILKEEQNRENRNLSEKITEQKIELEQEKEDFKMSEKMDKLVNESLALAGEDVENQKEVKKEYLFSVCLTEKELLKVKSVLLENNIVINSVKEIEF